MTKEASGCLKCATTSLQVVVWAFNIGFTGLAGFLIFWLVYWCNDKNMEAINLLTFGSLLGVLLIICIFGFFGLRQTSTTKILVYIILFFTASLALLFFFFLAAFDTATLDWVLPNGRKFFDNLSDTTKGILKLVVISWTISFCVDAFFLVMFRIASKRKDDIDTQLLKE